MALVLLFSLLIDHALLFYALSVLDELVVELVLDETIHHTSTNDEVTLRHLITHASRGHKFNYNRLRSLNPVSLQLLIADTIEKHLSVVVFRVGNLLALHHLQVTLVVGD